MARQTKTVTIDAEGRDKGKAFFITELPASQGEWWAIRAFLAIAKSGFDVPASVMAMGMVGVKVILLKGFANLAAQEAKPLLDELFECIEYIPNPSKSTVKRPLLEDDIEEIPTRWILRMEALSLHSDFFTAAANLTSESASASTITSSSNTQTSPI